MRPEPPTSIATTNEYDLDLLQRGLGHSDVVLPRVLGPHEHRRPDRTPSAHPVVGPGTGDNAGAALGLGAGPGDVVISIGTSGTVFAVTDTPTADASGAVAGFADASGHFLPLIATMNAARVLVSIAELLGVDLDTFAERSRSQPSPGRAGWCWCRTSKASARRTSLTRRRRLHGLTSRSTHAREPRPRGSEGMLCGLGAGLDAVRAVGVRERRLLLIGGAAQSPAVQTIAAQVFDAPVVVPAPASTSPRAPRSRRPGC